MNARNNHRREASIRQERTITLVWGRSPKGMIQARWLDGRHDRPEIFRRHAI